MRYTARLASDYLLGLAAILRHHILFPRNCGTGSGGFARSWRSFRNVTPPPYLMICTFRLGLVSSYNSVGVHEFELECFASFRFLESLLHHLRFFIAVACHWCTRKVVRELAHICGQERRERPAADCLRSDAMTCTIATSLGLHPLVHQVFPANRKSLDAVKIH